MRQGRIIQIGSGRDVYVNPANGFVASFIGEPNLLAATIDVNSCINGSGVATGAFGTLLCSLPSGYFSNEKVTLMVRPADLTLHKGQIPCGQNMLWGSVRRTIFLGNRVRCEIGIGSTVLQGEFPSSLELADGDEVTLEIPSNKVRVLVQ